MPRGNLACWQPIDLACVYFADCNTVRSQVGNSNIVTVQRTRFNVTCIQVCDTNDTTVNGTRCNIAGIQVLDGHIGCVNRAAANSVGRHSASCNLTGIDTGDVCVSDL